MRKLKKQRKPEIRFKSFEPAKKLRGHASHLVIFDDAAFFTEKEQKKLNL
jgi:hypothetical protein